MSVLNYYRDYLVTIYFRKNQKSGNTFRKRYVIATMEAKLPLKILKDNKMVD